LTASGNDAIYYKDGQRHEVAGQDLLKSAAPMPFFPTLALEQIPNRDSTAYGDIYGIPSAHTVYRGTLRYAGWCALFDELRATGLMDATEGVALPSTWAELLKEKPAAGEAAKRALQWLGAYSADLKVAPSPSVMDAFCTLLTERLSYAPGERDMVAMHHHFVAKYEDGRMEEHESSFMGFGEPGGQTSMAKTVGLTAGIGAELLLRGSIQGRGVLVPTTKDIYLPALEMLEKEGIVFEETVA